METAGLVLASYRDPGPLLLKGLGIRGSIEAHVRVLYLFSIIEWPIADRHNVNMICAGGTCTMDAIRS